MRMARVNITLPDELLLAARLAGLNVSRHAAHGLAEEIDRRAKLAELDAYLAELETERGPVTAREQAEAVRWVDRITSAQTAAAAKSGPAGSAKTARRARSA